MDSDQKFSVFRGRAPYWGICQIQMKEQAIGSGDEASLHSDPVGEHEGGLIYQELRGRGAEESSGDGCLSS